MTVHALHSEETGMVCRDRRNAHEGAADRCVQELSKSQGFIRSIGCDNAAAYIYIRLFACVDRACGFFYADLLGRLFFIRENARLRFIFAHSLLDVLGNIDKDGTRTA